jgi:hypothetical protein
LSAGPWTKRTEFLRGQVLPLDNSSQTRSAHSDTGTHLPISLSKAFHRPRYDHFLFGADKAYWTFGPYNSEYFAVILIPHAH